MLEHDGGGGRVCQGPLGAEPGPQGWRADLPRDFIPMKRFSTMSMRPTPCLPLWEEPSGHWGPRAGHQDSRLRGHLSRVNLPKHPLYRWGN